MKHTPRRGWNLGLAGLVLLGAGCSILPAPQPDATRYFVLTAVDLTRTNPGLAALPPLGNIAIGLGPITFPDYLARAAIVTQASGNRVELSPSDRWAEPLDVTFKRVLAQDLTTALGGNAQVAVFPWFGTPPRFAYRVEPTIDRCDADAQGVVHLVGRWTLIDGAGGGGLYSAPTVDISVAAAPGDESAMAAALSTATSEFAAAIAAVIRRETTSRR